MIGRRIRVRRTKEATYTPVKTEMAVYQVMRTTILGGLGAVKSGQRVLLPYTEEFWEDPNLLLVHVMEE